MLQEFCFELTFGVKTSVPAAFEQVARHEFRIAELVGQEGYQ